MNLLPLLPGGVRHAAIAAAAAASLSWQAPPDAAQAGAGASEYEVKAAFLFKFASFTTWPDDAFDGATAPLVFGVVGPDPFGRALDDALRDKKIGSHPVLIERYESLAKVRSPHLLFVGGVDPGEGGRVARALGGRPILVVGDCAGFAARGATAGFYLEGSKVRFEMNPGAARRARLSIAAQLLKLARIVG